MSATIAESYRALERENEQLRAALRQAEQERKELRTACTVAADLLNIVAPLAPIPAQCERIARQCLDAARLSK
jgi:hypothetical protein